MQSSKYATKWNISDLTRSGYAAGPPDFDVLATTIRDDVLESAIKQSRSPGQKKIVEVGSGLGRAFKGSRFVEDITQTDPNQDVVAKRRREGEQVFCVDASSMEQHFSSLDVVVANNVLDTLRQDAMTACISGIHAALRRGGKFIHFMDLNAYHQPRCQDLLEIGMMPFLFAHQNAPHIMPMPIELVTKHLADARLSSFDRQQIRWFIENPIEVINSFLGSTNGSLLLRSFSIAVETLRACANYSVAPSNFNELFQNSLYTVLNQFHIKFNDYHKRVLHVQGDPHVLLTKNSFTSTCGCLRSFFDGNLEPGETRLSIDVLVIIAEKQ